ncbi:MAG: MCE family protein [Burkholderiales bacterium]|nr:MCE family protein [Burkholderiales bacterium]
MNRPAATTIGLFVLGAVALTVAAILFFGGSALFAKRLAAVSFFHGSVAGLQIGAPVTYRGVEVGQVSAIGIRIDPKDFRTLVQVDMALVPEAVRFYGGEVLADNTLVPTLVQRGLTAQLVTQNFVTGMLTVDLGFRPDAELRKTETDLPTEVPTVPTDLERLARKARDIDLPALVDALQSTFVTLNRILDAPETAQTMRELPLLATQLRETLKTVNSEVKGLSDAVRTTTSASARSLDKTLKSVQALAATLEREAERTTAAVRSTLQTADKTIAGANSALAALPPTLEAGQRALEGAGQLLDPRGRTMIQIERGADDLAAAAARLRSLAERVDRDPSILIRGR